MRVLVTYGLFEPTAAHVQRLYDLAGEVVVAASEAAALAAAPEAEVILGHRYLSQCLPVAPRLRWVQSTSGGVDRLPLAALAERGVALTRVTHASAPVARHALALAWAVHRRLPEAYRRQIAGIPNKQFDWLPQPSTAAVFGTGPIGREIARLLKLAGIRVLGIKRRVTGESDSDFDRLHPLTSATDILAEADWCFIALPHKPETAGWFNARTLRLLPRQGILVNVGRGETVVTRDLCAALRAGQLGGAALDVVSPWPEPTDEFWQTPNLLVTPHIAAHSQERQSHLEKFVEEQLARYCRREPLFDLVDLPASLDSR